MTQRYELSGSGAGQTTPNHMRQIAKAYGATNIREVHQFGWKNQPMTIRFNAQSDSIAGKIASAVTALIDDQLHAFKI